MAKNYSCINEVEKFIKSAKQTYIIAVSLSQEKIDVAAMSL